MAVDATRRIDGQWPPSAAGRGGLWEAPDEVAPWPGPALAAVRLPPSTRAEQALVCRPDPLAPGLVVKPWLKMRPMFSGATPLPLSAISMAKRSGGRRRRRTAIRVAGEPWPA